MNDRVSAFCSGVGAAGLFLLLAFASGGQSQLTLVSVVLMVWSMILVPIGIIDFIYDSRRADKHP